MLSLATKPPFGSPTLMGQIESIKLDDVCGQKSSASLLEV
jgi:hypothetical protein